MHELLREGLLRVCRATLRWKGIQGLAVYCARLLEVRDRAPGNGVKPPCLETLWPQRSLSISGQCPSAAHPPVQSHEFSLLNCTLAAMPELAVDEKMLDEIRGVSLT